MNRHLLLPFATALAAAMLLSGCGSTPAATSAPAGSQTAGSGPVLPVSANPIVNTAASPTLEITYAAVQDNVAPGTATAISDRLEVTVKNTGPQDLSSFEAYYEMTDTKTGKKEGYYQKLDGLQVVAGKESTVYFDNETGAGHYPENKFSIYRTSANAVDVTVQVSAPGAKIAVGRAVKAANTGEKSD